MVSLPSEVLSGPNASKRLAVPVVLQWQCQKRTSVYSTQGRWSFEGIRSTATAPCGEDAGDPNHDSIGRTANNAELFYTGDLFYNNSMKFND
jgi:hypothetical protein